jgi:hypothetical protein
VWRNSLARVIYFAEPSSGGSVVIDFSAAPNRAVCALNRGRPDAERLRILVEMLGDRALEAELRHRFAYARRADGSYRLTPALRRLVSEVVAQAEQDPEAFGGARLPRRVPVLSDEERARRSERARRLVREGRFGGAVYGARGGRKSKRRRRGLLEEWGSRVKQ